MSLSLTTTVEPDASLLQQLERSLDAVPEDEYKYDPRPATEAMANWIRAQDPSRRRAIVHALRRWLEERDGWHAAAALDIAVELQSVDLIDAAVEEAPGRQSSDLIVQERSSYVLRLVGALAHVPTQIGVVWLRDLKNRAATARERRIRQIAARAWIVVCFTAEVSALSECIAGALGVVRSWEDPQVTRSVLRLVGVLAHERGTIDQLAPLLTEDEARVAFSVWRS